LGTLVTVGTITTLGLVSIELEVPAMIDIEVIAVTGTMIEGVSVVALQALIGIGILVAQIDTMIAITDMNTETIVQTGREITTVEKMTMIGLPPLRRTPY
jgi:hypothetical protein